MWHLPPGSALYELMFLAKSWTLYGPQFPYLWNTCPCRWGVRDITYEHFTGKNNLKMGMHSTQAITVLLCYRWRVDDTKRLGQWTEQKHVVSPSRALHSASTHTPRTLCTLSFLLPPMHTDEGRAADPLKWSEVQVARSCPTLWPLGQNTGVGSLSPLRGSPQPKDRTQVSRITGRFFTSWATREAQEYWSG